MDTSLVGRFLKKKEKRKKEAHSAAKLTVCSFPSLRSNITLLNSKVVTVIVKPTPNLVSTPVEIEFPHLHNVRP